MTYLEFKKSKNENTRKQAFYTAKKVHTILVSFGKQNSQKL